MKNKTKIIAITTTLIGILLILILINFNLAGFIVKEQETIKIGFLGPFTGPLAYTGDPVKNGFTLAHSKKSIVNNKKIEIIYEDSKCNPEQAVNAVNKLTNIDNVNIIVPAVCSSTVLGIAPIIEEKQVIIISPIAASPLITNSGDYVFRISSSSNLMASNAAVLAKQKGYKKVGILYELNDYPIGWKNSFKDEFESLNGEIIIEQGFNSGDSDLKSQLLKINQKNPDLILVNVLSAPSAINVLKQIQELDIKTPLLGNEVFGFKSVQNISQISQKMYVTDYDYDINSDQMKIFLSEYNQTYNKQVTEEIYAALGYDVYNLLYNAIEFCNSDNPVCIKNYLNSVGDMNGLGGSYYLDGNGDAIRNTVLKEIKK